MELKKTGARFAALLMVLGVLACNKEEKADNNACKADSDCKTGTLCEGSMCIPEDVAKKVREPKAEAPKEEEPKKEEAKEEEKPKEEWEGDIRVPKVPSEKSDPPTLPDWNKSPEVNTQHEHGLAKNCSMKVIREWVRVMCRGDVLGFQDLHDFGKKQQDYYISVRPGKSFSLVARIKQGPKQTVRICRKEDRASLVVYWPMKRSKPEHIALGDGPKCAVEEYHDGTETEEEEQASEEERADEKDDVDHGKAEEESKDGDAEKEEGKDDSEKKAEGDDSAEDKKADDKTADDEKAEDKKADDAKADDAKADAKADEAKADDAKKADDGKKEGAEPAPQPKSDGKPE